MAKLSKQAFNSLFHQELSRVRPLWQFTAHSDEDRVLVRPIKNPPLTGSLNNPSTVTLATAFSPGRDLEQIAKELLDETLREDQIAADTAVAIRMPAHLKDTTDDISKEIRSAFFSYFVFNRQDVEAQRWPEDGWLAGGLRELIDCIELVSTSSRHIARSACSLELVVDQVSTVIARASSQSKQLDMNIAKVIQQEPGELTFRMAAIILTNAMAYHDVVRRHINLATLEQILQHVSPGTKLLETWRYVARDVRFLVIFHVAIQLMSALGARLADQITRLLAEAAQQLKVGNLTSFYDLPGQLFQKQISDRKSLASFYTQPTSSTLLAEIALAILPTNWGDHTELGRLRIADLACGSGTLISAVYRGILKRYEFMGLDTTKTHCELLANSVYAADVLPSAAYMAASQLSSFHPHANLVRTQVYSLPFGNQPSESDKVMALGSLDLLATKYDVCQADGASKVTTPTLRNSVRNKPTIASESLDLVIMNPPFTSPTNHKITDVPVPSFAGFSTTDAEQTEMAAKLKRIYKSVENRIGNGNAELASNFCDLAHLKLKKGGVLALVLPIAAVSGASWKGLREMLSEQYTEVTVITISAQKSQDRSFSADTGMAECLIIGKKNNLMKRQVKSGTTSVFTNDQPRSSKLLILQVPSLIRKTANTARSNLAIPL